MSLQTRPLSYALGAEITGIDISKPLGEQTVAAIRAAFLEHGVLLFRGQPLTRAQHVAFSRQFGELEKTQPHRIAHGLKEYPEILLVIYRPHQDGSPVDLHYQGEGWHTDRSFTTTPPLASLLRGIDLPDVGGDTMFANMYRAYETLSNGMKKLIDSLDGVHVQEGRQLDYSSPEKLEESRRRNRTAQPLVRVHPETGRKALFLGYRIRKIAGMTADESKALLDTLSDHATRPQLVYRHVWQKDDLVMWDNCCTLHRGVGDYDKTQLRHLERTTVKGAPSGYAYDGPLD